jgi:hypothetical protein
MEGVRATALARVYGSTAVNSPAYIPGQATYVAGTGKFVGLSGTVALATEGTTAFKPITEGTYVGVTALDGHYKLP